MTLSQSLGVPLPLGRSRSSSGPQEAINAANTLTIRTPSV
jgi:hypothetical protein